MGPFDTVALAEALREDGHTLEGGPYSNDPLGYLQNQVKGHLLELAEHCLCTYNIVALRVLAGPQDETFAVDEALVNGAKAKTWELMEDDGFPAAFIQGHIETNVAESVFRKALSVWEKHSHVLKPFKL